MKKPEDYLTRINELIELADKVLITQTGNDMYHSVNGEMFMNFKTSGLSCIKNLYGIEHPFYLEFHNEVRHNNGSSYTKKGKGILTAIKSEIEGGWFTSIKGLVSAEIFSNFLEMAKHLLDEGYKDPAAVMIGSVLEEHLRQLCIKYKIDITFTNPKGEVVPKKADTLNADLGKAHVYNLIDQKQITTWLDLRNKAAHGKYNEYSIEQVRLFYDGFLNFHTRISL